MNMKLFMYSQGILPRYYEWGIRKYSLIDNICMHVFIWVI